MLAVGSVVLGILCVGVALVVGVGVGWRGGGLDGDGDVGMLVAVGEEGVG